MQPGETPSKQRRSLQILRPPMDLCLHLFLLGSPLGLYHIDDYSESTINPNLTGIRLRFCNIRGDATCSGTGSLRRKYPADDFPAKEMVGYSFSYGA